MDVNIIFQNYNINQVIFMKIMYIEMKFTKLHLVHRMFLN